MLFFFGTPSTFLFQTYHIGYCTDRIYADLSGTDRLDRILWCGKGN